MDARLIVVGGKANKSEVKLKLPTTIGRSRAADLTVAHPKVSRQHCQIFERDGMLVVRDNGSLNGTYIGDSKITESVLKPGEKLTVGPLTFVAAYEPVQADAGMMPTVDLPTPLFEPPTVPLPEAASVGEPAASKAEGEADAWLDESPGFSASYPEPAPDSASWPPEAPVAEEPLPANDLPPLMPPVADDFRLPDASELAETVRADEPGTLHLHTSKPTVALPPATVALDAPPLPAAAPLSPDDFQLPNLNESEGGGEVPSTSDWLPPVHGQAQAVDAALLPPFVVAEEPAQEPIGWSPGLADPQPPASLVETIGAAGQDTTAQIEPPLIVFESSQKAEETCTIQPSAPALNGRSKATDRTAGRKGWWPFGGKNKPQPTGASASPANSAPVESPPAVGDETPLAAETPLLPPGMVLSEDEPKQPIAPSPPLAYESAEIESEPTTTDDEELSEFFKSLGQ